MFFVDQCVIIWKRLTCLVSVFCIIYELRYIVSYAINPKCGASSETSQKREAELAAIVENATRYLSADR